ncbi:MAG: phosphatidylglycerophosphatase A [Rhodocyclales bacterium]|nr:phosphatidylglycerophosphatase A [Rhodocyclales bacterium]
MAKSTPPPVAFLFRHPAHLIACGFGSGLSPWAPGTIGTLFAWASYPLLRPWFDELGFILLLITCYIGGVLACHRTGKNLGEADHGSIVWDEIVPFWAVLFLCPEGWLWQTTAFFLFRFFDIVKPPPACNFDRIKNGFGVMTDDVFAAAYTVLVLALLKFILG